MPVRHSSGPLLPERRQACAAIGYDLACGGTPPLMFLKLYGKGFVGIFYTKKLKAKKFEDRMDIKSVFKMPKPVKITGKISIITNSFISSIIPVVLPKEEEIIRVLEILKLEPNNVKCAYCGDNSTEWDHFRPLVKSKRPTG
ncbi:MAG: hypothetical protein ACE5EK_07465, partial [Nitrospinales bacterium]